MGYELGDLEDLGGKSERAADEGKRKEKIGRSDIGMTVNGRGKMAPVKGGAT